jgi:small subunit ribosomal protein S20
VPKIKSAIKRVEVSERNRTSNRAWKSTVRTARNHVAETLKSSAKKTEADQSLSQAYKVIDMAVSKGVLHKNAAARQKSSLARQVLQAASSAK